MNRKQQRKQADELLFEAFHQPEPATLEEVEKRTGLPRKIVGRWAEKAVKENRISTCCIHQHSETGERVHYFTTNKNVLLQWKLRAAILEAENKIPPNRL